MKKSAYWIVAMLALAACNGQDAVKKGEGMMDAIKVTAKPVMKSSAENELHYSGTIEPEHSAALMFKNAGTIESVFVEEGDHVKKGQVLATLDKSTSQHMYEVSLASWEQAKDAYERLKEVHDKGSLTDIKWVEMESKMKQAESQLQIAKSNLEDCELRAPENGMIGRRTAETGQSSIGLSAPFELVKIDRILVKISVPENEISQFKKGMKASFTVSALDDSTFSGTVSRVGIVADKIARTYDVRIEAQNPNCCIKPGMVCDVRIPSPGHRQVLVIPSQAVTVNDRGNPYVWKVSRNKVNRVPVRLGNYTPDGIAVYEGLVENDLVVTEGKEKLSDNSSILF
jgi:RND family efflux transporter MFP subunit